MSYKVDGSAKQNIVGRPTKQGLVCVLRPNRREPRPVTARSVGSLAGSARYNDPEELILVEVLRRLPRVRSELCVIANLAIATDKFIATLKLVIAGIGVATAFAKAIPGGAGLAIALLGFTLALESFVESWTKYFSSVGVLSTLSKECL